MKRIRFWIRNYFGFSSTETNGFLVLLPLMAVFIFSEPIYRWWYISYEYQPENDSHKLDSLMTTLKWSKSEEKKQLVDSVQRRLIAFNPNTTSAEAFVSLGLSTKMVQRIIHYREKGGKFKIKNDFRKIYGMDSMLANTLEPFLQLPDHPLSKNPISGEKKSSFISSSKTRAPPFDLNLADTSQLITVFGIGPKLSKRIISYRTRLGGFTRMEQLKEIFGLDSAVVKELRKKSYIASNFIPRRIDLNLADKKELTSLPYIRFSLANAITVWRFQHGAFKTVEELKQILQVDEVTFEKIKPYLTVNY